MDNPATRPLTESQQERLARAGRLVGEAAAQLAGALEQALSSDAGGRPLENRLRSGPEALEKASPVVVDIILSDFPGATVAECAEGRGQVPIGNTMNAGLLEKLRSAAWAHDMTINTVLHEAICREPTMREAIRGEPYKVHPHTRSMRRSTNS